MGVAVMEFEGPVLPCIFTAPCLCLTGGTAIQTRGTGWGTECRNTHTYMHARTHEDWWKPAKTFLTSREHIPMYKKHINKAKYTRGANIQKRIALKIKSIDPLLRLTSFQWCITISQYAERNQIGLLRGCSFYFSREDGWLLGCCVV
jgi:hypothetical protein